MSEVLSDALRAALNDSDPSPRRGEQVDIRREEAAKPVDVRRSGYPSADLIARALVLAAMDCCELSVLVKQPDAALRGRVCFRSRWVAFEALCATHLQADHVALGRLIGCGPNPIAAMLHQRSCSWWSDARAAGLVAALASGAPIHPIYTPSSAYGVLLLIKDRIEERL